MKIEIEIVETTAKVVLGETRLDATTAVEFRREILAAVPEKAQDLRIDLSAVTFIDSSGIGVLISALKAVGRSGELQLCGVRESVMSVFEITHMDRLFTFKPNVGS